MKIAIAENDDCNNVSCHVDQARNWLVFDCEPGQPITEPQHFQLSNEQLPH